MKPHTTRHTSIDAHGPSLDEERKALLPDSEIGPSQDLEAEQSSRWRIPRRVAEGLAIFSVFFLVGYLCTPSLLEAIARPRHPRPTKELFDSQRLRSNGTHNFRKTALIVSIDGLRYVYTPCGLLSDDHMETEQCRLPRQRIDSPPIGYQ